MFTDEIVKKNGIVDVETESASIFELEECAPETLRQAVLLPRNQRLYLG